MATASRIFMLSFAGEPVRSCDCTTDPGNPAALVVVKSELVVARPRGPDSQVQMKRSSRTMENTARFTNTPPVLPEKEDSSPRNTPRQFSHLYTLYAAPSPNDCLRYDCLHVQYEQPIVRKVLRSDEFLRSFLQGIRSDRIRGKLHDHAKLRAMQHGRI